MCFRNQICQSIFTIFLKRFSPVSPRIAENLQDDAVVKGQLVQVTGVYSAESVKGQKDLELQQSQARRDSVISCGMVWCGVGHVYAMGLQLPAVCCLLRCLLKV